jgi:hypothetical protein
VKTGSYQAKPVCFRFRPQPPEHVQARLCAPRPRRRELHTRTGAANQLRQFFDTVHGERLAAAWRPALARLSAL